MEKESLLAKDAQRMLEPGGPIARALPGFEPRPPQIAMARAVAETLERGGTLLVEAPTGVGKTISYLSALAAHLSRDVDGKAIASTATITLQEQLVRKDLPVFNAVGRGVRSILLKGMGRYLCLLKWRGFASQLPLGPTHELTRFGGWVEHTERGDQAELDAVPAWWNEVAADHNDCLGSNCSLYLSCFAMNAREEARRAQLIVTNHHMLLLYRRFGTSASLLPSTAPVIIDEAHHLADIATEIYGTSISDFTFVALTQRINGAARTGSDPLHQLIASALAAHRSMMDHLQPRSTEPARRPPIPAQTIAGYLAVITSLADALSSRQWDVIRDRSGTSANERAQILLKMLEGYREAVTSIFVPAEGTTSWIQPMPSKQVRFMLRNAPIQIGGALGGLFGQDAPPAILTSATLAAGGSFAHLKARLGINQARELILPPVFDYPRQMRYYLPREPLDPTGRAFTKQLGRELTELLRATEGRALVLFTSYEQLRATAEELRGRLPYSLLVQDERSTSAILQQFRDDVHSVLLATSRFWEGIDVPGSALSALVVCRLPFDVPTHPLARARYEAAQARGEQAFATIVIPEAIIRLRQGVGRLIRSTHDRGIVAILDGRVQTKPYGRRFLAALPPAPTLRTHDEVHPRPGSRPRKPDLRKP